MELKSYFHSFTDEELVKGAELFFAGEMGKLEINEEAVKSGGKIKISGEHSSRTGEGKIRVNKCTLWLDGQYGHVEKTSCSCGGFTKDMYGCEHVAALLTYYVSKKMGEDIFRNTILEDQLKRLTMSDDPFARGVLKRTDDRLLELLGNQAEQQLPQWHEKVNTNDILKVQCAFTRVAGEGILFEIKIGSARLYQVKDLAELINAYRFRGIIMLGKKDYRLDPVYCDRTARKILNYLSDIMTAHEQGLRSGKLFSKTMGNRYLRPAAKDMDTILEILDGQEILAFSEPIRVNLEKKGLKAVVRKKNYGADIQIESMLPLFEGEGWTYVSDETDLFRVKTEDSRERKLLENLLSCSEPLYIRESDIGAVIRQIMPVFKEHGQILAKGLDVENYEIEKPFYEFRMDFTGRETLICQCNACYERQDTKYQLFDSISGKGLRNAADEAKVSAFLSSVFDYFDPASGVLSSDLTEDELFEFMKETLPEFEKLGIVYVTDSLKKNRVKKLPNMSVRLLAEDGGLLMSISGSGLTEDEMDEILKAYTKKKKYYRLKSGEFLALENKDEEENHIWDTVSEVYRHYGRKNPESISLPLYRAMYLQEAIQNGEDSVVETNEEYRSLVAAMNPVDDMGKNKIPKKLEKILRPYQADGFNWICTLKNCGFGGILADDMGLGKTLQVLAFLLAEKQKKKKGDKLRTIIITPASLLYNWRKEIEAFTPDLKTVVIAGSAEYRKNLIESRPDADVWITSYDLAKRDIKSYTDIKFANEIIDEAQFIKNQNTQAAQAVKVINSDFRLALTGTPIENHLSELWSIMDYLMPGFLYSSEHFKSEYEIPIVTRDDQDALDRIRRMVHPFILRRMKKQVLKDLPDKVEEVVTVRLGSRQKEIYDAMVTQLRLKLEKTSGEEFRNGKLEFLAQLTRLREACCDPSLLYTDYNGESAKLDACMQLISQAVEGGHKLLLFSQFTSMLDIICARLESEGFKYHRIDGSVSKEKRMDMVDSFANDDVPVFVISLKAGGTGLNLTAADIVIHYDPWWNQAAQNQATDRTHRIGQTKSVNVYEIIAENTIEERIQKIKAAKSKLAEDVLSGESISSTFIDKDDMLSLLE